ncbi:MAG: hypothetical protein JSV56_00880, partial [Methanomassiliicoccales archaeon]
SVIVTPGAVQNIILTPSSVMESADGSDIFRVVGTDADGNENWSWQPVWDWVVAPGVGLGSISPISPYNVSVSYIRVGTDDIIVSLSGVPSINDTASVTVTPGQVARIEITPWPSSTNLTGDIGNYSVVGYDADDNENWTWTPQWVWNDTALGALTSITPYNYTVTFDTMGSDFINVSSSSDPSVYNTSSVTVSILEPTVDYITIMDAPGGTDNNVTTMEFIVNETHIFYAAGWNYTLGYVMDVDVIWTSSNVANGTVETGPANSTLFRANASHGGEVVITATNATLTVPSNFTGTLTIIPPNIDYIQIRDAPSGGGNVVLSVSMNSDDTEMFYAAGYNATTRLFVSDVSVIWNITTGVGVIDIITGYATNLSASTLTGVNITGTLKATYNIISNSTEVFVDLRPPAPTGLTVSRVPAGEELILTWTVSTEPDVRGYLIYRSTSSQTGFTLLATVVGAGDTTHMDTSLANGATYYYYIQAFDDGPNYSPGSLEVSATCDKDTDGDGTYDLEDDDDDDDGLTDAQEDELGTDPKDPDSDNDGYIDSEDDFPNDASRWKEEEPEEDEIPFFLILLLIIVVIVVLLLVMLSRRRKPEEEEVPEEEEEVEEAPEEEPEEEEWEEEWEEEPEEYEEEYEEVPEEEEYEEVEYEEEPEGEEVIYEEEEAPEEYEEEPEEEVIYEEEEAVEEGSEEEDLGLEDLEFECPDCGYPVTATMDKCPKCGIEFEFEEEEE